MNNKKIEAIDRILYDTGKYRKQISYLSYANIDNYVLLKHLNNIEGELKKLRHDATLEEVKK